MANAELQSAIDELKTTTNDATTVMDSAIAFVVGNGAIITTLREELERLGATPEQIALVREAETTLETKKDELVAALLANTGTGPGTGGTPPR